MTTAGSVIDFNVCTAAKDCKTASACCGKVQTTKGTDIATPLLCIPAGTDAAAAITIPAGQGTLTAGAGFNSAACPKAAAAGASTLAVSAVAAATAVYMM